MHLRPRAVRQLSQSELRRILTVIDDNIANNITIAGLAPEIGMSPSHFSRCFKATSGASPYAFVTDRRIHAAAKLMIETNCSLEDAAQSVGFSNLGHFRKRLRKSFGCNPSDLRTALKIGVAKPSGIRKTSGEGKKIRCDIEFFFKTRHFLYPDKPVIEGAEVRVVRFEDLGTD